MPTHVPLALRHRSWRSLHCRARNRARSRSITAGPLCHYLANRAPLSRRHRVLGCGTAFRDNRRAIPLLCHDRAGKQALRQSAARPPIIRFCDHVRFHSFVTIEPGSSLCVNRWRGFHVFAMVGLQSRGVADGREWIRGRRSLGIAVGCGACFPVRGALASSLGLLLCPGIRRWERIPCE
jgi:hypothetical protein